MPDERRLVRLAKSGDPDAFASLYDGYLDRIYRYIYFRVADQQTAEDLTSQVFAKAWEHLGRYKPSGAPFIAWLYTIARNAVIDHYRTQKESVALDDVVALSSDSPPPDEVAEGHFEAEALRGALQDLTAEQQQVLILRFIAGLGTDEIAAQLGKRAGAVRALQMRALQALAKIMENEKVV
jgi:RNA polymerase sigma-70 factor (ECF subfamily)